MFSLTNQTLVQCGHRMTKISSKERYSMFQKIHSNLCLAPRIYETVLNLCLLHDCIYTVFYNRFYKLFFLSLFVEDES